MIRPAKDTLITKACAAINNAWMIFVKPFYQLVRGDFWAGKSDDLTSQQILEDWMIDDLIKVRIERDAAAKSTKTK